MPVQSDASPPPQQHEASIAGDLLHVARVVLLDWRPPEMMPTSETGPTARCVLSPQSYRMDIREDRGRYVVKLAFIKQAECGVFVDTDVTYEVSKDRLEIISRPNEPRPDGGLIPVVAPDPSRDGGPMLATDAGLTLREDAGFNGR